MYALAFLPPLLPPVGPKERRWDAEGKYRLNCQCWSGEELGLPVILLLQTALEMSCRQHKDGFWRKQATHQGAWENCHAGAVLLPPACLGPAPCPAATVTSCCPLAAHSPSIQPEPSAATFPVQLPALRP